MERLTKQNPSWIDDELWRAAYEPDETIDEFYRRLKAYEDTGLTPEEITKTFDNYRDTNLSQAQELYDLEQERDTLKNALELACDAFDYTPSGHTLMDLYIQQAQEGKDNAE